MAYGFDINDLILKEFSAEIGTWTNPQSLVSTTNPLLSWTGEALGHIKSGSEVFNLVREYALAEAGTPKIKLRKDLTKKDWSANLELFQFNKDIMALCLGAKVESAGSYPLAHIGPDEDRCTNSPFNGFLFKSERVDCTAIYIGMYYCMVPTEDVSTALNSTDHAVVPMMIEAFAHPNFNLTTSTDREKAYGAWWLDES